MSLTTINIQGANNFDAQAVTDATDWLAQSLTEVGTGIFAGAAVSPSSGMVVSIAPGTFAIAGSTYTFGTAILATVTAASGTDRKDIITISNATAVTVTVGTACGVAGWTRSSTALPPVKPTIPANNALLAEIYVANTTTTIGTANIVDKTTITSHGQYVESWTATAVAIASVTPVNIGTVSLPSGAWNITGRANFYGTATTLGTASFWLGPNSASSANAYAGAQISVGTLAGGAKSNSVSITKIVNLVSPTTVYLGAYVGQIGTALGSATQSNVPNVTGITAFRII